MTNTKPQPSLEATVENYRQALVTHDWDYEMTEDPRVWHQGRHHRNILLAIQPQLDPDFKIWNSIAPPEHRK